MNKLIAFSFFIVICISSAHCSEKSGKKIFINPFEQKQFSSEDLRDLINQDLINNNKLPSTENINTEEDSQEEFVEDPEENKDPNGEFSFDDIFNYK